MAEEIRILQLSVSDSRRREKDALESEERLEEYQNRVIAIQRKMEERSAVAEGKIRSLQTENEALRLHLKLALESLKNPIPAVRFVTADDDSGLEDGGSDHAAAAAEVETEKVAEAGELINKKARSATPGVDAAQDNDKENDPHNGDEDTDHDDGYSSGGYDDNDDEDEDEHDNNDMHDYMQELLSDLTMFRRKIGDDKGRFLMGKGGSGAANRSPLAERVNV